MLIIAGSPDINVSLFIQLMKESSCQLTAQSFDEWKQNPFAPQGFVYIKVLPEISFKRLQEKSENISLNEIQRIHQEHHDYFVDKITMPSQYHELPTLILNGFVDFEKDLSQFYNHLFYIQKILGNYVPPKHNTCCKH